jgi:5'-nucleotidase
VRILLTNDDGVHAEGLLALKQAVDSLGEVVIVAPDRPRSACGHSITLHKPLRVLPAKLADGSPAFSTSGTPSDCVSLALMEVLRDRRPDVVISGINHGPNLGWDLTYSGTVSAAMEAAIMGLQSISVSVAWRLERMVEEEEGPAPPIDFAPAGRFVADLLRRLASHPLPVHSMLNVNVPASRPTGVEITRQGIRRYPGKVEKRLDPMGRTYYWLGGDSPEDTMEEGTDVKAVAEGRISVTPIQLDLTDYPLLKQMARWPWPEVERRPAAPTANDAVPSAGGRESAEVEAEAPRDSST